MQLICTGGSKPIPLTLPPEVVKELDEGAGWLRGLCEDMQADADELARDLFQKVKQPEPEPEPEEKQCDPIGCPPPPDGDDDSGYNLAFGVSEHILGFANSFVTLTYIFFDWPDEIVTDENGNTLRLADPNIFKAHFHGIMSTYFIQEPNGRLKFNLEDIDDTAPNALTTWELREIKFIIHLVKVHVTDSMIT